MLIRQNELELIVPSLVIDEFERNRERVEALTTASVARRFKNIRQDLDYYGGTEDNHSLRVIEDRARHVPLTGAMTTRNSSHNGLQRHSSGPRVGSHPSG